MSEKADMAKALLPCPFCGSSDVDVGSDTWNIRAKAVGCGNCGATGPLSARRLDARRLWNERKP